MSFANWARNTDSHAGVRNFGLANDWRIRMTGEDIEADAAAMAESARTTRKARVRAGMVLGIG